MSEITLSLRYFGDTTSFGRLPHAEQVELIAYDQVVGEDAAKRAKAGPSLPPGLRGRR